MCDNFFIYSLKCTVSSTFYPYLTALIVQRELLKQIYSFRSYDELNFLWTFHCKLSLDWKDQKWFLHCSFVNTGTLVSDCRLKHFFLCLNSVVFKVFICENRKLSFLNLKHILFQHLHKNPKWTVMRHSQMVTVAKHTLSSKVFLPLFTQAWKLLPGYYLFLLSIHCSF